MPDPTPQRPEDAFATALDAIVTGCAPTSDAATHLSQFASHLQSAAVAGLPDTERAAIWERLLTSRPETAAQVSPATPIPGGGAAVTLPASTLRPDAAFPRRPDRRSLRFVPETRNFPTIPLVMAIIILVGGIFSTLRPDDHRSFVPSASATELAPAIPFASPVASPAMGCAEATARPGAAAPEFVIDPSLRRFPWFAMETTGDVEIVGIQWYGDRTLTVGGVFASVGMSAKTMWTASEMLRNVEITASRTDAASSEPVGIPATAITGLAGG
ncbi:MAG TPA: hypothetical protein VD767_07045, partial [Thermomicrobiales bacterium]|nr:hypothetical protein [Thermomicrobiales bacterium]